MKSTPIERLRQSQKEKREARLNARRLKNAKVVSKISDKPTHFEIGDSLYEFNFFGFTKALAKGFVLLLALGLGSGLFIMAIYFLALLMKGQL